MWGGNLTEMAAAICSASALAHLTDGLYFYPDDDLLYTADEALAVTREDLKHVPRSRRASEAVQRVALGGKESRKKSENSRTRFGLNSDIHFFLLS